MPWDQLMMVPRHPGQNEDEAKMKLGVCVKNVTSVAP